MRLFSVGSLFALIASLTTLRAQLPCMLFTGSRPFVSRDVIHERPGGAITQLSEYDISMMLPTGGFSVARTLIPATAIQSYLGDGDFDGNYLKFLGWKAFYDQAIGLGGLFVKAADRGNVTWDKIYFSVRFGPGVIAEEFEVFVAGGIPYLVEPSDWVRLMPNGSSQWFLAPGQLLTAAGPQQSGGPVGCGALLQSAAGDLYYSPSDGGHWVSGIAGPSLFASDGAICKIDAANISYDSAGNVMGITPGCARLLSNELLGSGSPSVRGWVQQSGAMDRTGAAMQVSDYGKTGGLAFDPGGGTWMPAYPDASGNFVAEPNMIFCTESPEYAGTLFSTRNGGEVAVITNTTCGSTVAGVPADGSWLGVEFDLAADQPSILGFTLIDIPPYPDYLIADQDEYGLLRDAAVQPTWNIDFHGTPNMPILGLFCEGPQGAASFPVSMPINLIPLPMASNSWPDLFHVSSALNLGATITNSHGYATITRANPNLVGLSGFTAMVQGVGLHAAGLQFSTPILIQLQ
jgi:hypothetical protein